MGARRSQVLLAAAGARNEVTTVGRSRVRDVPVHLCFQEDGGEQGVTGYGF